MRLGTLLWWTPLQSGRVYVVTTAAGQSFETMYEDTPFFLSIHRVNAITVLSAVPRLRQSLLSGCFARGVQGGWIF